MTCPTTSRRRQVLRGLAGLTGIAAPALISYRARAGLGGRLAIGGTGAAYGTMKLLAEAFKAEHPDLQLELPRSLGTSGGIKALLAGALDVATTLRDANDEEHARGVASRVYGRTLFVFATSHAAPPSDLTSADVVEILSFKRRNWPDGLPIRLVLRPKSDSDIEFLARSLAGAGRAVETALALQSIPIGRTDQENLDLAEQMKGSFAGTSLCTLLSEQRNLRVIALDGAQPSLATLASGAYKLARPLYLFTTPGSSPAAQAFIEFIGTRNGASILNRVGIAAGA